MLNDIFATSMAGEYTTRRGDTIAEQGRWDYTGYGNAEIRMTASGEISEDSLKYDLMIHSAERQLDEVTLNFRQVQDGHDTEQRLRAVIAAHDVAIEYNDGKNDRKGSLSAPEEAVYDGPSPIWMIHLMLVELPPEDREIITPVIYVDPRDGALEGGIYRLKRDGLRVDVVEMSAEGEERGRQSIELADDGCPRFIRNGDRTTEILRFPQHSQTE
jgi:hypothetical protein